MQDLDIPPVSNSTPFIPDETCPLYEKESLFIEIQICLEGYHIWKRLEDTQISEHDFPLAFLYEYEE